MVQRFFSVARPVGRLGQLRYWTGRHWAQDEARARLMRFRTACSTVRQQGNGAFHIPMTEIQARANDDYVLLRRRGSYWAVIGNYTEWTYDQLPTKPQATDAARRIVGEGLGKLYDEDADMRFIPLQPFRSPLTIANFREVSLDQENEGRDTRNTAEAATKPKTRRKGAKHPKRRTKNKRSRK